ncbi:hypothetical protein Pelo_205 [Pelomyxa schiedti]|nr:hypothetical protein Pelo_205 [Pelomyxa schiedti]
MRSALLVSLLLFFSTTSAIWEETIYYEMTDSDSCSSPIYVEVEQTSTCYASTDCYWGSDYNSWTHCLDEMPAIDSYFDEPYYSYILWTDECNGKEVFQFIVAKESCVMSSYMSTYRGWKCNQAQGEITKTGNYDDSTCAAGYDYDTLTPYYGYRHGECFYSSGSGYYSVDCDAASTATAGYQLITYHPILSEVGACDGTTAILGYEYYYTDDCASYDCVAGPTWMETWSCVATEPSPWTLISDTTNPPFVLRYFSHNDNFCSSDELTSTEVWASTCMATSASTSINIVETSSYLNFEVFNYAADCTSYYTTEQYIYKGGDETVPGCFRTTSSDGMYYSLSQEQSFNKAYQTIEYFAGVNTSATKIMIEQFYTEHCLTQTDDGGLSFANWICTDAENLPDPFDYWDDAILELYFGTEASSCSEGNDWLFRRAMTRDCVADQDSSKGYSHFGCSSTATSSDLRFWSNGDANCTGGTYSYIDYSSSSGMKMDYCLAGAYADYSFSELHCDPPNPAYQIMKTYTDAAKTELISVEVFYTDYCTEVEPTSSNFAFDYTCQASIDTLTIDIDMAITVTRFSDSTCTTPKKHWNYYSPECHDSDITTDSYHVTCSADDSYADVEVYSCDADTLDGCRGSCSYFSEEVDATRWSGPFILSLVQPSLKRPVTRWLTCTISGQR